MMNRKTVSGMLLILLFLSVLTFMFDVKVVKAPPPTFYIRADGSIEPSTANIVTSDFVTYEFTGDNMAPIVVERSGIVIDGKGYRVIAPQLGVGDGFSFTSINNVTIKRVVVRDFSGGIYVERSSNFTILDNTVMDCDYFGIWLASSTGIILRNNTLTDNKYNFAVSGSAFPQIAHDIDTTNTVDGKPIYYLVNRQSMTVPSDAGYVAIVNSTNITVEGLELKNNYHGIFLFESKDSVIRNNNITDSQYGIYLRTSNNNTVSQNNFIHCQTNGIRLYKSSNNTLSDNRVEHAAIGVDLESWCNSNVIIKSNITDNTHGVSVSQSSFNTVSENNVLNNVLGDAIILSSYSNSNIVSRNFIRNNGEGLHLATYSDNNTIFDNIFKSNLYGIHTELSITPKAFNNKIYHNNVLDSGYSQVQISDECTNIWDDGYPSGGNYWDDYVGTDANHDGIGDTPYVINANNQDNYPLMIFTGTHNIAITSLTPYKTIVGQSRQTKMNIKVVNYGLAAETFNVTVYANTTIIGTFTRVNLAGNTSTTLSLKWTPNLLYGNYILTAVATQAPGEIDTADNTFSYSTIIVTLPGDYDGNGIVNIGDGALVGRWWMQRVPPAPANVDIDEDTFINIQDAATVGANWQKHT